MESSRRPAARRHVADHPRYVTVQGKRFRGAQALAMEGGLLRLARLRQALPCKFDARPAPHNVPGPALDGRRGHATAHRQLPAAARQRDHAQHRYDRRVLAARLVRADVLLEHVRHLAARGEGDRGRPVGLRELAGVATSCPPPRHDFYRIPRIRSERPAVEAHYPHIKWGRESRGIEQTVPAIESVRK